MESIGKSPSVSVQEIFEKCLGCKWTLHVLAQIRAGVARPGELERTAPGLTTKVLNERLTKLTRLGILSKESFAEVPPKVEYKLTKFGKEFVQVIDQIDALQQRYAAVESE